MEIQIIQKQCGGTEFVPLPHRLHLGGQNAAGIDRLQFTLPESWNGYACALYLRRSDGTLLAPIPLDSENSVTVDQRLTGCTGGQWMLAAVKDEGHTAYTRPGSYDTYATLPTDGSEEVTPSMYEQFVARVLESASTAVDAAKNAAANAEQARLRADQAKGAVQQIVNDRSYAAACAARAEDAAARAEKAAPTDGQVLSVNGKGGAVELTAQELGALPRPAAPVAGQLLRILSIDPDSGELLTDTTAEPDLSGYLRQNDIPDVEAAGGVRADRQYGVTVRSDGTMTLVPASTAQLDSMSHAFAPLVPAMLPYGVKKSLTTAAGKATWSETEKSAARQTLGMEEQFYTKEAADEKFGAGYELPTANSATLGGVKIGEGITVYADGTIAVTEKDLTAVLGYSGTTLRERLENMERKMNMDGKLVYTGTGSVTGKAGTSFMVSTAVDYLVVKAVGGIAFEANGSATSAAGGAAAADALSCKVMRGCSAVILLSRGYSTSSSGNLAGVIPIGYATVAFGSDGTVTVSAHSGDNSTAARFNTEGYQYV